MIRRLVQHSPGFLVLSLALAIHAAQAQTFSVIHRFKGSPSDGATPMASLIADSVGNLYGTTQYGGAYGYGTAFELRPSLKLTVLHSFCPAPLCTGDGTEPLGGLLRDVAGNLYGTTVDGPGAARNGTVFRLSRTHSGQWNETILYDFPNFGPYGPRGTLISDSTGNLYGTTWGFDNVSGTGTVFKLAPSKSIPWKQTTLYTFTGGLNDGGGPMDGVTMDAAGNLYGTTYDGGIASHGTVFEVTPTLTPPWSETILHQFTAGNDGGYSTAGLLLDAQGNLYGTTESDGVNSGGVVFKLSRGGTETVLHAFCAVDAFTCSDGRAPVAGVIADAQGNLYGTTQWGGLGGGCEGRCGVVFKLDPLGNETVLYAFTGGADGGVPTGGLYMDAGGNLYGTTSTGGDPLCQCGTIFKITP